MKDIGQILIKYGGLILFQNFDMTNEIEKNKKITIHIFEYL